MVILCSNGSTSSETHWGRRNIPLHSLAASLLHLTRTAFWRLTLKQILGNVDIKVCTRRLPACFSAVIKVAVQHCCCCFDLSPARRRAGPWRQTGHGRRGGKSHQSAASVRPDPGQRWWRFLKVASYTIGWIIHGFLCRASRRACRSCVARIEESLCPEVLNSVATARASIITRIPSSAPL